MLELGDEVEFEARHLGVTQRLRSKVVEYERPTRFVDEMQKGAFARMRHTHEFQPTASGTRMIDTLDFVAPFGPLGALGALIFLGAYMRRFLKGQTGS